VPAPGVKVSSIETLHREIAMSLGASGVRVVALRDSVGIEVPNNVPSIVPLKSMLDDDSFRHSKAELPIAIGYTINREVKTFDLTDAPHLLIAGATKQGKSVGLNVIISSLLYAKHPTELKFVFIDPKMVEFTAYNALLKHYLAVLPMAASEEDERENAIIKQPKQAEQVLNSLCIEMDERYKLLASAGVNDIKLYNEKYKDRHLLPTDGHKFLPYLVVVIDEYADLTMTGGANSDARKSAKNISDSIVRLAQKGRAAGLHVIIATQRPSVNVITGLIKTNFPTRIAFRVVSGVDSRTILDSYGAENLIGRGDMLYYAGVEMERVQCALVSMAEINKITKFIGDQTGYRQCCNTPYYLPVPESQDGETSGGSIDMDKLDPLFEDAARMVVTSQRGSTSDLQRKMGMGYARAGRVMDQLEGAGIVGPQEGSKPRQVLVTTFEELDEILSHFI
jgi:S-DNA-T family DNA segregation ATPase FtsK/SpoIIIE